MREISSIRLQKFLSVVCALILLPTVANAAASCVSKAKHGCFTTIQQAVNAASPGSLIYVYPGTYPEMVTIRKPLTLSGFSLNGIGTRIDASGLAHAIYISGVSGGKVTVAKLTLENADRSGIVAENSSHVSLSGNTVSNNDKALNPVAATCAHAYPFLGEDCGEGINLVGVSYSTVSGNIVKNNAGGILLSDETGATHDNLIADNSVFSNPFDCGITLASHPPCLPGSNDAVGCKGGPQIGKPSPGVYRNLVRSNNSHDNGAAGVGSYTPTPGTASHDNTFLDNTLVNNGQGGVLLHSHAPGQNLNGNVIEGNQIRGNGGDPDSEGANPPSVGIVVFSDASAHAAPLTGIVVRKNTIHDEDVDLFVGTSAVNLTPSLNNLFPSSRTTVGLNNAGTGTIKAAHNYWGCPSGPGSGGCSSVEGSGVSTNPPLLFPYLGL
ncbi:MAG TPA: right-handed parallel beta-helix repeat-containing protein [Candidatus Binataceae bacterium]|nr:right-handed parallel beta-helix repeat-containing protein [Candidatus Binataceae bacterium]